MAPASGSPHFSLEDFLAIPEDVRFELIDSELVPRPWTSADHGRAHFAVASLLGNRFGGRLAPGQSCGWWFLPSLDLQFGPEVLRPDVCGYRRDKHPERPRGRELMTAVPDWVCEILSTTTSSRDRVEKLQIYFAAGVPHYWLIDPEAGSLEILRRTDLAYAVMQVARRGQRLRPEPFGEVEFLIDVLLGDDPEDD